MDETFQTYLTRVSRLTQPGSYRSFLQNIQESPKFTQTSTGDMKPVYFPGYTVTTPLWKDDSENSEFFSSLKESQQELAKRLPHNFFIPVLPETFHMTLADLIWNGAYQEAVKENPSFDSQLRDRIAESFEAYQKSFPSHPPIRWQLLGLSIRPRALMVALIPKDEQSYEYILQLRRAIYQNSGLIGLGVEQQYHFTAHVTLGYFGEIASNLDRDRIQGILTSIDEKWLESDPKIYTVKQAQLYKFEDMTHYHRKENYPILKF
ncbi:MAG: DUF1868 domain-containing protein [Chroococcales cyanobacterium]